MPIRKGDYPPDWTQLSIAARERAGQKCEWCGAPNGKIIRRTGHPEEKEQHVGCSPETRIYRVDWELAPKEMHVRGSCEVETTANMNWKRLRFHGLTKIILTVAHLDRDRHNNAPENLAALCQRCHLNHDRAAQHIPHRKYGRHHDREQQGKLELNDPMTSMTTNDSQ